MILVVKDKNSASVAFSHHAGDEETMKEVIKIIKINNVSIYIHLKDPEI